jgi:hypothetical protein
MNKDLQSGTRLIYGRDPWAEGEEIALIVLDLNVVDLLEQMRVAKTWGEATRGAPHLLNDRNEERWDAGEPPLQPDDPFDLQAERTQEHGVFNRAIYSLHFDAFVVDERLKPHVRFCRYRRACWLRDDESASLALELLRASGDRDATLVRDDSTVGWVVEGLLEGL